MVAPRSAASRTASASALSGWSAGRLSDHHVARGAEHGEEVVEVVRNAGRQVP